MRYQSFQANIGETAYIPAKFLTGATVTVVVYDLSTGSSVTLTAGTASEIGSTGYFVWASSDITTQPTSIKQYLVVFTDGDGQKFAQKFMVGGYVDSTSLADYQGVVHIDTSSAYSGTDYPNGVARRPVNNYADAYTIATTLGITEFHIKGSITLTNSHVGWKFKSATSAMNDSVAVNGQNCNNSSFEEMTVTGAFGGTVSKNITMIDCRSAVTAFDGVIYGGGINGSLGLASTGVGLLNDVKMLTGGGGIDANNASQLLWSNAQGIVQITNFTNGAGLMLISADSVVLTLAASCTGGTYAIGGFGLLTDSGSMSVLYNELRSKAVDLTLMENAVLPLATI